MTYIITASVWIIGIFLAKGFFSTLFAIVVPPWAWYLVVEAIAMRLAS